MDVRHLAGPTPVGRDGATGLETCSVPHIDLGNDVA
jgi:hypothetical protein